MKIADAVFRFIASAAIKGEENRVVNGYNSPVPSGTPSALWTKSLSVLQAPQLRDSHRKWLAGAAARATGRLRAEHDQVVLLGRAGALAAEARCAPGR